MTSKEIVPCPVCGVPLVAGAEKSYETLNEHVMDPNGERPVRPTLVCGNEKCILHGKGFWSVLPDGEWYSNNLWKTGNVPDLEGSAYGREKPKGAVTAVSRGDYWVAAWRKAKTDLPKAIELGMKAGGVLTTIGDVVTEEDTRAVVWAIAAEVTGNRKGATVRLLRDIFKAHGEEEKAYNLLPMQE